MKLRTFLCSAGKVCSEVSSLTKQLIASGLTVFWYFFAAILPALAATTTNPELIGIPTPTTSIRNNFAGWLGFQFRVGDKPVWITDLGRWVYTGNTAGHAVKITYASDDTDVPGAGVTIYTSGATTNQFLYVALSAPVQLQPNTTYNLICQESNGGDRWYDYMTTLVPNPAIRVLSSVYGASSAVAKIGDPDSTYIPLNMKALVPAVGPRTGRFLRGANDNPTYTSFVMPFNQQTGIEVPALDGAFYGVSNTLWFTQVQRDVRREISQRGPGVVTLTNLTAIPVQNPIALFGASQGGSTLYPGWTYSFGLYAGGLDENSANANAPKIVKISAYPKSSFTPSATNLTTANIVYLTMPRRSVSGDSNAWQSFMANGSAVSQTLCGLTSSLEFVDGATNADITMPWGLSWYTAGSPLANFRLTGFKLSHQAADDATNYNFVIEALGAVQTNNTTAIPLCTNSSGAWAYSPMYTLDYTPKPKSNLTFIDQPHFETQPLPPFYQGKSPAELAQISMAQSNLTAIWLYTNSAYRTLNNSSELRTHPDLDKLVTDLNRDPVAIANYVQNEIGLVDPVSVSGLGQADTNSLICGGVNRAAVGVYWEGQGTPTEQCGLLIYLLRKAGYAAAFAWPTNANVKMLDSRVGNMLKMQLSGVDNAYGDPALQPGLITVNYPWVVLNLTNNRCIHLFPWLKDNEITQGLNVWDYLPSAYNSGEKWVRKYMVGDTNILNGDPENNLPLYLLPKFINASIATSAPGLSIDDFGVKVQNRKHFYSRWEDFPTPTLVTNQSQIAIVDNLSNTNFTFLNQIFDTFQLQIFLGNTLKWDLGEMKMADLHNRRWLIRSKGYFFDGSGNYKNWLDMDLSPYYDGITNADHSFSGDIAGHQTWYQDLALNPALYTDVSHFRLYTIYRKHRWSWSPQLGFLSAQENTPDYFVQEFSCAQNTVNVYTDWSDARSEFSSLVFNVGKVSTQMMKVHSDAYIKVQQARAAANGTNPAWYDYCGAAANVLGMNYYENKSRFEPLCEQLTGGRILGHYEVGLAKISPRIVNGTARNQGNIDFPLFPTVVMGNNSFRPDSPETAFSTRDDYLWLFSANSSAAEHHTIEKTLPGGSAISTVRLLQLAQTRANASPGLAGIVELNSKNYVALGAQTNANWSTVALKDVDAAIWGSVTARFSDWDADYVKIFLTPGKVTNESLSYIGMGALELGKEGMGALIGGNGIANGGAGGFMASFGLTASSVNLNYNIGSTVLGGLCFVNTAVDTGLGRDIFSWSELATFGSTTFDLFSNSVKSWAASASYWLGDAYNSANAILHSEDRGFFGESSFLKTAFNFVADPVNVVTGEFYIDDADLTLPGPLPIELRRNYLSQNESDGPLGFGWKLNLTPYLFATTNTNSIVLVMAANLDGSTIAFRKQGDGTYKLDPQDNPLLTNDSREGKGGIKNWFNAKLVAFTTNSTVPAFLLTEPNGSIRTYVQRTDFAMSGSSSLSRVRPYLSTWQDTRGNLLTFNFGTDNTKTDYGQVARIESSNGDALMFQYDAYNRITEAFTRDGRRVKYAYDEHGDLRQVTLADGSTRAYEYQHADANPPMIYSLASNFNTNSSSTNPWQYWLRSSAFDYSTTDGHAFYNCKAGSNWSSTLPQSPMLWGDTSADFVVGPGIFKTGAAPSTDVYGSEAAFIPPRTGTIRITGDVTGPTNSATTYPAYVRIFTSIFLHSDWIPVPKGSLVPMGMTLSVDPGWVIRFDMAAYPTGSTPDYIRWNPTIVYLDGLTNSSTHLLTLETKPDGRLLKNIYDDKRRVTTQLATVGLDMQLYTNATFVYTQTVDNTNIGSSTITGNTVVTDIRGNAITYGYGASLITNITDALGTTKQEWYSNTATTPGYKRSLLRTTDKRGLVTQYLYDPAGNVTNTLTYVTNTVPATLKADLTGDGTTVVTTSATYNANNLVTSITDPSGNWTTNYYSGTFPYLLAKTVRYSGSTTYSTNSYSYYSTNLVSSDGVNTFTNAAYGLPLQTVRAGAVTDFTHDTHGYLVKETASPTSDDTISTDPVVTKSYFYNLRGELVEADRANGRKTLLGYDDGGRPIAKEVYDETGKALTREYTYYNDNGEVVWADGSRSNPEDYVWRDYDGAGHLSAQIVWRSQAKADGTGVEATSQSQFATTLHYFDGFGNETNSVNALGHTVAMQYDALGQMTNQIVFDATSGSLVALATNRMVYEPGGQVSASYSPIGGFTTNIYNVLGKLVERRNPDGSTNLWTFYSDGRPKKEIQANGSYWLTTYNDPARTVTRTFYDLNNTSLAVETKVTDGRGNVISTTDANGNVFTTQYDGLDRVKFTRGPVFDGAAGHYQSTTYTYDNSEALVTQTNAKGEKQVTAKDAAGRTLSLTVIDANSYTNRFTRNIYSLDNNSVTTIAGLGTGSLTNTTYTDTQGQTVLTIPGIPSEYRITTYDPAGRLVASRDELGQVTTHAYDGLGREIKTTQPDGAISTRIYDSAGNLATNVFPNGMKAVSLFDASGRVFTNQLISSSGTVTRQTTNTYYTSGAIGKLATMTDARGNVHTYSYDAFLRVTNQVDGTLSLAYQYDALGQPLLVQQTIGSQVVRVERSYSPYGKTLQETVKENGTVFSSLAQNWDNTGRRIELYNAASWLTQGSGNGDDITFAWQADGMLSQTTVGSLTSLYGYDLAGQLGGRISPWRTWSAYTRDARGRLLYSTTQVGAGTPMTETLTWRADSKMATYSASRSGTGSWSDSRTFSYNNRGQLTGESFTPPGLSASSLTYGYDSAKLGVRISAAQAGGLNNDWDAPAGQPDGFGRLTSENSAMSQWFFTARGKAAGALSVGLTLDGTSQTVGYNPLGTDGLWQSSLSFGSGSHTLIATATHPIGAGTNYLAKATNTFTASGTGTISVSYDGMGNVTTRTWSGTNGRSLSYVFDELGRLTRVTELAGTATNSVWVAQYDALGRRYRTTSTPYVGGVAGTTAVTESWFDPEVKFLEVAVTTQGQRWWNVHGPDLSGTYGSEHGMGGLEGSIREADGVNEGLVPDNFGHGVGTISSGSVTWNATVETGYGPAMGYEAARLGGNVSPMKAVSWRGQRMESFGLYVFGSGRPYNPLNGRFESPDPMGHDAATSLYDYADGDPVNGVDADGLVAKGIMEGLHTDNSTPANSSIGFDLGYSYGSLLNGIAEGFRGGSQITANTLTFGGSDALNWTHSTDYQGWEYTGTRGLSTIGREALIGAATLGSFQMARGGSEAALFTYQGLQIANTARSGFAFGTGVNQVANGDNWGYANIVGGALGLAGGFGMAAAAPELNGGIQTMRRGVAESFYESAGYSSDRIASHLEGIDFSKSVRVTTINQGKQMIQWQKPGTPVGRYFAEVGTTADQLGVSAAGRVNTLYTASRNTPALRSTAADTSSNMKIPPEFRGGGGGTQFFVPDKGVFAPSSP